MYEQLYGNIPEDFDGRIKYILNTRNAESIVKKASAIQKAAKKIKKHNVQFTFYIEPKPSARPRLTSVGGYPRFYVPNAQLTKKNFQHFYRLHGDLPFITTPMEFNVIAYAKTPSNFNKLQTLLAEFGIIRPWGRTFDNDNVYKAYTDCTMGTLIEDDSLICDTKIQKFYSIRPRIEFSITYLDKFPEV
jgi:Holliday junction resolvase RusA-like endonuclease